MAIAHVLPPTVLWHYPPPNWLMQLSLLVLQCDMEILQNIVLFYVNGLHVASTIYRQIIPSHMTWVCYVLQ